ncbi:Beta-galactosidase BglY [compost metagenome]
MNQKGKGRAYYMATRLKDDFLKPFYGRLAEVAGLERVIDTKLPHGVTAQARTNGTDDFVFIQNYGGTPLRVELDGRSYTDMETGKAAGDAIELGTNGIRVLKRQAKSW